MNSIPTDKPSLLSFPCQFPIKIVGKADPEFEGAVMQIMRRHVPDLSEGAVSEHYSKEGKYISMTVTITAASQEQLDAIYLALSADSHVIMAL
jgi:putative lipoic acid-binding regulatory protein